MAEVKKIKILKVRLTPEEISEVRNCDMLVLEIFSSTENMYCEERFYSKDFIKDKVLSE